MAKWKAWHKKKNHARALTERQKQVLYFVRAFQYKNRFSPISTEVAAFFGFGTDQAGIHVRNLVNKGYLEMSDHPIPYFRRLRFPKDIEFPEPGTHPQFPKEVFPKEIWKRLKKLQK